MIGYSTCDCSACGWPHLRDDLDDEGRCPECVESDGYVEEETWEDAEEEVCCYEGD